MAKKGEKLSPMQKAFVREYLLCRNATKAAEKAGYSKISAQGQGSRLLLNAMVQELIKNHETKVEHKFEITQEKIIEELASVGFGHIGRVMDWKEDSIELIPKSEMEERDMKFIESIQLTEFKNNETDTTTTTFKIKTLAGHKVSALEKLGKHIGMWKDGNAGSGSNQETQRAAIERIRAYLTKRNKK